MPAIMSDTEPLTLREEQLISPDVNAGRIIFSFHPAAKTAGLLDAQSLRFNPTTVDGEPVLVGRGMDRKVDGRSHIHSRTLFARTDAEETRRGTQVTVPPADFETVFGLTREDLEEREAAGDLPRIQVLTTPGEQVVVFKRPCELTIDREVIPDVVE